MNNIIEQTEDYIVVMDEGMMLVYIFGDICEDELKHYLIKRVAREILTDGRSRALCLDELEHNISEKIRFIETAKFISL